jgi:hypothetical protein
MASKRRPEIDGLSNPERRRAFFVVLAGKHIDRRDT